MPDEILPRDILMAVRDGLGAIGEIEIILPDESGTKCLPLGSCIVKDDIAAYVTVVADDRPRKFMIVAIEVFDK